MQSEWDDARPQQQQDLASVEHELREVKATVDRYLRALETGAMSPQLCGDRLVEVKERQSALECRRIELAEALHDEPLRPDLEPILTVARELAQELEREEPPRTKKILSGLIDQLKVESRALIARYSVCPWCVLWVVGWA